MIKLYSKSPSTSYWNPTYKAPPKPCLPVHVLKIIRITLSFENRGVCDKHMICFLCLFQNSILTRAYLCPGQVKDSSTVRCHCLSTGVGNHRNSKFIVR